MIYAGIIGSIFVLELFVKNQVEKKVKSGSVKKFFHGKILLKKHHNRGWMFNKGENRQRLVAYVSLVFTLMLVCFALFLGEKGNSMIKTGLSFILGGAFSNTYDRLFRKYVVDYLSFGVKSERFRRIIFNLSDFCIMIGAILLVVGGAGNEDIG